MDRVNSAASSPSRTRAAALMALGSMISVQLGAPLARSTMDSYGPFVTNWGRLAWAAVFLGLIVRPDIRSYHRNEILVALALGAVTAMMTALFFAAIARVPLGLVVAIEFLGPLSVAALGFAGGWRLIWLAPAVVGVLLLARDRQGWSVDLIGFGYALAAGAGWGIYIGLTKRIGKAFKGLDGLAISVAAAALISTPFALFETGFALPGGLVAQTAGFAILAPLLPYILEMMALRRLPSATFGILMSAEPGIAALVGYIILHEPLSTRQIAGIALVIGASAGAVISTRA